MTILELFHNLSNNSKSQILRYNVSIYII
jgi:hypothetical protein